MSRALLCACLLSACGPAEQASFRPGPADATHTTEPTATSPTPTSTTGPTTSSTTSPTTPPGDTGVEVEPSPDGFSIVLLPDTQIYAQSYPETFVAQAQWIVDNRDKERIAFVLHEGDITNQNSTEQWENAVSAMELLDGVVPYVLAVGNHDMGSGGSANTRDTTLFNTHFPVSLFESQSWFGGVFEPGKMDNSYARFEAGGVPWLVFGLEFGPRDVVLDWTSTVLDAHPDHAAVVVTHAHVYSDETLHGSSPSHSWTPRSYGLNQSEGDVNDGHEVWEALQHHANLAFIFNGHVLNDGAGRTTLLGTEGNLVHQMLANYQMLTAGGSGWMRILRLEPGQRSMHVETFSPTLGRINGDIQQGFTLYDLGLFDGVDRNAPKIASVSSLGGSDRVAVVFDETLDQATAEDPGNYQVSGGVAVLTASLASDARTVELWLATLAEGADHTLTVQGVADRSSQRNPMGTQDWTFTYQGDSFSETFADGDMDGWQIVQQGTTSGPAEWQVDGAWLGQLSNVYGVADATENRLGTYVMLDDPLAEGWTDYRLSVTLRSDDNDGIGVLVRAHDNGDHYKVELESQRSFRKLTRTQGGDELLLAESPDGYVTGEVMQLEVELRGNQIEVWLDGLSLFGGPVSDSALTTGAVGLYCWGNEGCWFDDIVVSDIVHGG